MNEEGTIYHDDSDAGPPDEDVQRLREHFERIAGEIDGELEKIHKERMADLDRIAERLRGHEKPSDDEEGVTVTIHEKPGEES